MSPSYQFGVHDNNLFVFVKNMMIFIIYYNLNFLKNIEYLLK